MDHVQSLARASGPRGEVVLRRRTGDQGAVEELIVNGAFAMDSAETTTEQQLARLAMAGPARRVLVGGLGLGYTAAELLDLGVEHLDVVEIESVLLDWARAGLTATLARVGGDPRVRLHQGDVAEVLTGRSELSGPWDAIVLDVDNGPDFLIHSANAGLYSSAVLGAAYAQLGDPGVLLVWCQGVAPALRAVMAEIAGGSLEHRYQVHRGNRVIEYVIYALARGAWPA